MKRYMWIVPVVTLTAISFFTVSRRFAAASGVDQNGGDRTAAPLAVTLSAATRGVVFKTAAINSDATVAGCFGCTGAVHIGVGLYQVNFNSNVQAINGWSRWVQTDTLTTGTTNAYCSTADRAGNNSAVWLNCQNASGP